MLRQNVSAQLLGHLRLLASPVVGSPASWESFPSSGEICFTVTSTGGVRGNLTIKHGATTVQLEARGSRSTMLFDALARMVHNKRILPDLQYVGFAQGIFLVQVAVRLPGDIISGHHKWKRDVHAQNLLNALTPCFSDTRDGSAAAAAKSSSAIVAGAGAAPTIDAAPATAPSPEELATCIAQLLSQEPNMDEQAAAEHYSLLSVFRELPSCSADPLPPPLVLATPADQTSLHDLPHEAIIQVVSCVSARDMAALCCCCRYLRTVGWDSVPALKLQLYPHQRAAVRWMMSREARVGPLEAHPFIRTWTTAVGVYVYADLSTGDLSLLPPPILSDVKGGFFCDEPGLGKTITALSLILKTLGTVPPAPPGAATTWTHDVAGRPAAFYVLQPPGQASGTALDPSRSPGLRPTRSRRCQMDACASGSGSYQLPEVASGEPFAPAARRPQRVVTNASRSDARLEVATAATAKGSGRATAAGDVGAVGRIASADGGSDGVTGDGDERRASAVQHGRGSRSNRRHSRPTIPTATDLAGLLQDAHQGQDVAAEVVAEAGPAQTSAAAAAAAAAAAVAAAACVGEEQQMPVAAPSRLGSATLTPAGSTAADDVAVLDLPIPDDAGLELQGVNTSAARKRCSTATEDVDGAKADVGERGLRSIGMQQLTEEVGRADAAPLSGRPTRAVNKRARFADGCAAVTGNGASGAVKDVDGASGASDGAPPQPSHSGGSGGWRKQVCASKGVLRGGSRCSSGSRGDSGCDSDAGPSLSSVSVSLDLSELEDSTNMYVQCDACNKWRRLPEGCVLPGGQASWFCHLHPYPDMRHCDLPEEHDVADNELFQDCPGYVPIGAEQGAEANVVHFRTLLTQHCRPDFLYRSSSSLTALHWLAQLPPSQLLATAAPGAKGVRVPLLHRDAGAIFRKLDLRNDTEREQQQQRGGRRGGAGGRGRGRTGGAGRGGRGTGSAVAEHTWHQPWYLRRLQLDQAALMRALREGGLRDMAARRVYLSPATLVVVPPTIIAHWQQQIQMHVLPRTLRVAVLGGGDDASLSALQLAWDYDLVITTFQHLSNSWSVEGRETNALLKVHWLRIILDEGHMLGTTLNVTSKLQMACELIADRRWVMTGTPTPATPSSNVSHLQPLLSFLHHQPYGVSRETWQCAVQRPCDARRPEGRQRLWDLLHRCMIRASKSDLVTLPPLIRKATLLPFAPTHAASYNELIEMVHRNLLLADWWDEDHRESLLNSVNSKYSKEMANNVRMCCCVSGSTNTMVKEEDVLETLQFLCERLGHAAPPHTDYPHHDGLWLPADHPLVATERALRHGTRCQVCHEVAKVPMVTPCGHLACLGCTATSSTQCPLPSCRAPYTMQAVDDPERLKTNRVPKWPVPLELIEWQPVYHQKGAVGLEGGTWSPNYQRTQSTKIVHLLRRLAAIGAWQQQQHHHHLDVGTSLLRRQSSSGASAEGLEDEETPTSLLPLVLGEAATASAPLRADSSLPVARQSYLSVRRRGVGGMRRALRGQQALVEGAGSVSGHGALVRSASSLLLLQPLGGSTKVIVFSQFWVHMQLIDMHLTAHAVRHELLKQNSKPSERAAALAQFRSDPACCVLVMDEVGAVGLDLSFVTHIFLMEPIQDRSLEQQIISRAHRMGATRAVHVELLVMQGTAEHDLAYWMGEVDVPPPHNAGPQEAATGVKAGATHLATSALLPLAEGEVVPVASISGPSTLNHGTQQTTVGSASLASAQQQPAAAGAGLSGASVAGPSGVAPCEVALSSPLPAAPNHDSPGAVAAAPPMVPPTGSSSLLPAGLSTTAAASALRNRMFLRLHKVPVQALPVYEDVMESNDSGAAEAFTSYVPEAGPTSRFGRAQGMYGRPQALVEGDSEDLSDDEIAASPSTLPPDDASAAVAPTHLASSSCGGAPAGHADVSLPLSEGSMLGAGVTVGWPTADSADGVQAAGVLQLPGQAEGTRAKRVRFGGE